MQGIILQLTDEPPTPSLFRPTLTSAQPAVLPGSTLQLSGQYFSGKASTATLTLGSAMLGTATVSPQGTFTATVTIPASTPAGAVTLHAVAGRQTADASVQVLAARGAPTLIASFQRHLLSLVATDGPFTVIGAGFVPPAPSAPSRGGLNICTTAIATSLVTIYLDSTAGPQIGPDGTFTADVTVTAAQIGNAPRQHTLIAVQGATQANLTLTLVLPEVIH